MNVCIDNTIIYEEFDYTDKDGKMFEIVVQKEDFEFVTIDIISYTEKGVEVQRYSSVYPCHDEEKSSLGNAKDTFYNFIKEQ